MTTELAVSERPKPVPPKQNKYNEERHKIIINEVSKGLPLSLAGPKADVHSKTVNTWFNAGLEDEEGPYGRFALEVQKAQANFLMSLIEEWRTVGSQTKQWTAFATMAERLFPETFAKKDSKKADIQINIGILEQRIHEIQSQGATVYRGG